MTELLRLQKKLDREIDARKQAEDLLEQKSLELYNSNKQLLLKKSDLEKEIQLRQIDLIEAQKVAKVGTGFWDLGQNKTEWSDELYKILGYEKDEVLPGFESYLKKVHPDDKSNVSEEFYNLNSKLSAAPPRPGFKLSFEHRILPHHDREIWVTVTVEVAKPRNGGSIFLWGVLQDITDLKLAQFNLEAKQDQLSKQADALQILNKFAVKIADFETNEDLVWHVVEEVVGKLGFEDCVIYLLDDDQKNLIQVAGLGEKTTKNKSLYNPLKIKIGTGITGNSAKNRKLELVQDISKDSRYIVDLNTSGSELCVPLIFEGKLYGVIDSESDKVNFFTEEQVQILTTIGSMTSARLAQIESYISLTLANNAAKKANQEKSRFLATMSHELRTPINGVLGSLNLIEKMDLSKEATRLLERAQSSGELLKSLIDDILDLGKLEAGKMKIEPQVFEVRKLLKQVSDLWRPSASVKNVEIEFIAKDEVPTYAKAGFDRIRQVLVNFMSNAVKFTPRGKITISVKLKESKNILLFSVSDTGIGIKESDQSKLFKLFSQVGEGHNRIYGGTGMGLAISSQLASLMDGIVGVESQFGSGSNFWLEIPFEKVEEADATITKKSKSFDLSQAYGKEPRILIVDDIATNQLIVGEILKRAGARFDMAASGVEAIEALKNQPYDLVLMDLAMPELDGVETTKIIRSWEESISTVPIMALTAYDFDDQLPNLKEAGFSGLASKPIDEEDLLNQISVLLTDQDAKEKSVRFFEKVIEKQFKGVREKKLPTLIQCLHSDIEQDLTRLNECFYQNDIEGLEQSSHRLKSTSGACGAEILMNLASQINIQTREQRYIPPENDVKKLLSEGELLVQALNNISQQLEGRKT